jgi:hypothetical protein
MKIQVQLWTVRQIQTQRHQTRNNMRFRLALVLCLLCPLLAQAASAPVITTDEVAIQRSVEVLRKYKLTSRAADCMAFTVDQKKPYFVVDIRELHNKTCGGDPDSMPELYTVRLRGSDGAASIYDAIADDYWPAADYRKRVKAEEQDAVVP